MCAMEWKRRYVLEAEIREVTGVQIMQVLEDHSWDVAFVLSNMLKHSQDFAQRHVI